MAPLARNSFAREGIEVGLGRLRLDSTSGVMVEVSSTLSVSKGTEPAAVEELEAALKAADHQMIPWIWPASSELTVLLHLQHNSGVQPQETRALLQDMATDVQDADYWQRLPIAPATIEVEPDTAAIRVTLRLDDLDPATSEPYKLSNSRKAKAQPGLLVSPPNGVTVIKLQAVHLNIGFGDGRTSGPDDPVSTATDEKLTESQLREDEELLLNDLKRASGSADSVDDLDFCSDYNCQLVFASQSTDKGEGMVCMISTLHYAIQSAMFGGGRGHQEGIRRNRASKMWALSEIIPALWRPGYLAAMSERAALMPTIEQVLTKTVSRDLSGEPARPSFQLQLWDVLQKGALEAREPLRVAHRAQGRPDREHPWPSMLSILGDEILLEEDGFDEEFIAKAVVDAASTLDYFGDLLNDSDQSVSDGEEFLYPEPDRPKEAVWPSCVLEDDFDALDEECLLFEHPPANGPAKTAPGQEFATLQPPPVLQTDQPSVTTEMLAI